MWRHLSVASEPPSLSSTQGIADVVAATAAYPQYAINRAPAPPLATLASREQRPCSCIEHQGAPVVAVKRLPVRTRVSHTAAVVCEPEKKRPHAKVVPSPMGLSSENAPSTKKHHVHTRAHRGIPGVHEVDAEVAHEKDRHPALRMMRLSANDHPRQIARTKTRK
jgi:hypothetical protein